MAEQFSWLRWCWIKRDDSVAAVRERERVVQVKGGFKAYSTKVARNKAARKRKATLNIRNNERRNGTTGSKRERGLPQLKWLHAATTENDWGTHPDVSINRQSIYCGISLKIICFRWKTTFTSQSFCTIGASVKSEIRVHHTHTQKIALTETRNAAFLCEWRALRSLNVRNTTTTPLIIVNRRRCKRAASRSKSLFFDRQFNGLRSVWMTK